jgi:hypothetical protein
MFVQAEPGRTHEQGGLGIGLSLVRRLVEKHGGTVVAHSEGAGCGSEFVVRLPRLAQVENPPPPEHVNGTAVVRTMPARRVLVVDDNQDAADSLAMVLKMVGHNVLVAHDGPAALDLAENHTPEVIFLDIGLPGMTGLEVARQIRTRP